MSVLWFLVIGFDLMVMLWGWVVIFDGFVLFCCLSVEFVAEWLFWLVMFGLCVFACFRDVCFGLLLFVFWLWCRCVCVCGVDGVYFVLLISLFIL